MAKRFCASSGSTSSCQSMVREANISPTTVGAMCGKVSGDSVCIGAWLPGWLRGSFVRGQETCNGRTNREARDVFNPAKLAIGVNFQKDIAPIRGQNHVNGAITQSEGRDQAETPVLDLRRELMDIVRGMRQVIVPPIVFGTVRHLRVDLTGKDVAADDRDPEFHVLRHVGLHNHRTEAERRGKPEVLHRYGMRIYIPGVCRAPRRGIDGVAVEGFTNDATRVAPIEIEKLL